MRLFPKVVYLSLTTFLWEEVKHTEFFQRFLDEVAEEGDLSRYHSPNYRALFYEELQQTMYALLSDPSTAPQAKAAVTYNMIVALVTLYLTGCP